MGVGYNIVNSWYSILTVLNPLLNTHIDWCDKMRCEVGVLMISNVLKHTYSYYMMCVGIF